MNKEWSEDIAGIVREIVEKKLKNKVVQAVPKLLFFSTKTLGTLPFLPRQHWAGRQVISAKMG